MKRPLPIGISDFKKIIDGGYAYVDKTLFIQEIIEKGTHVALIPRLRRFGKTVNLSMLRYFFEKQEEETSYLFKNFAIWKLEEYRALQGQFPVIFISLKDVKCSSWQETFEMMQALIFQEFNRHRYLVEGDTLFPEEKEVYFTILNKGSNLALLTLSLLLLTEWLHRYHKRMVIVLIDEYDTPAHAAYMGEYYNTLVNFLRNWLSSGLKDNPHLKFGVLTGVLRIAKESIFSGMNNINTFTILNEEFSDKFGLLESEVSQLLEEYHLSQKLPQVREWYNGYRIGSCTGIYNPSSVLNCISKNGALAPYWMNTSDNVLMKQLIIKGTDEIKADIEELLRGGMIEKSIEEGAVFPEFEKNPNSIWSLLLFSGYVTIDTTPSYGIPCRLKIPNLEIAELYRLMILDWFAVSIQGPKYRLLLNSLIGV